MKENNQKTHTYQQHQRSGASHIEHRIEDVVLIELKTRKQRREEILI
jgi:hypothetical protein